MADLNLIVQITVTKTGAPITRAGFGTPLFVSQFPTSIFTGRFRLYSSTTEMLADGFVAADNAVQWATVVFSQDTSPSLIAIGRRGEGVAQVDTLTIATAALGTWSIDINGTVYAFIATGTSTEQEIAVGLADAINNSVPGPEPVNASLPAGGIFLVTADVAGDSFVNGGIVVAGGGAGTFVNTTPDGAAEDITTALNAILAENTKDWYLLNIEDRDDADITAAALFIGAQKKVGVFQSSDPDVITGTTPNILSVLAATNNKRAMYIWHDDDREYGDGAMASIAGAADLDSENGQITWANKQFSAVPADDLSTAEINFILAASGNVHVPFSIGRDALLSGTSVEGEFMDVQTTLDWLEFRTQEDFAAILLTTPTKIPFTNAGIAQFENAMKGRLEIGVTNNHLSPDAARTVTVPDVADISSDDKNNRILRNLKGSATLSGAIHTVIADITVQA